MSLEHWETYYRGGALATCPLGPGTGYTLELREVWMQFFGALPDGAQVLDVGTGNGAVALLAREAAASAGRRFVICATDLARIDPVRHVPNGASLFAGIEFHPEVATERLPFPAGTFDAVSGQYALEYTTVETALRELLRVTKPGACGQFILHHTDSVIVRNGRESLQHCDLVLNESHVFRRLRRFLGAERRCAPIAARSGWQDLVAATRSLQQAAGRAGTALTLRVVLDAVQKLLEARRKMTSTALDREVDRVEADVRASRRRLRDLVAVALDDGGAMRLRAAVEAVGFGETELQLQRHDGKHVVGWRLGFRRGSA